MGNQCTTGSEGYCQDSSQHDTDDAQGEGIEIRGDDLGDAHESTSVMEIPTTDGVIPTLDRTSSVTSNDHEANKNSYQEDRCCNSSEDQGSTENPPGFTNSVQGRLKHRRSTGPFGRTVPTIGDSHMGSSSRRGLPTSLDGPIGLSICRERHPKRRIASPSRPPNASQRCTVVWRSW
jgi:hypothetical protein